MTSTKSCHNAVGSFRTMFRWHLRRNRLLFAIYFGLSVLSVPVVLLFNVIYYRSGSWDSVEAMNFQVAQNAAATMNTLIAYLLVPLTVFFLAVYSINAFGYLHSRRSVDLFHSMPIRRTPLLLSGFAAGLVPMWCSTCTVFLLCAGVGRAFGLTLPFGWMMIVMALGIFLMLSTAVLAMCMFFYVASGTLVDALMAAAMLNAGWPILCVCMQLTMQQFLPGFVRQSWILLETALAPVAALFLPFGQFNSSYAGSDAASLTYLSTPYAVDWTFFVWWLAVAAALVLWSVYIYKRRKSECAEDNFSFPLVRVVLRSLVSAAAGLGFASLLAQLTQSPLGFFIAAVVGTALTHIVIQLAWARGTRGLRRSLPACGVVTAGMAIFFAVLAAGGLGFVNRLPDVSQVESVAVIFSPNYYPADGSKQAYLASSGGLTPIREDNSYLNSINPLLTSEKSIQTAEQLHRVVAGRYHAPYLPGQNQEDFFSLSFTYTLKNGREFQRTYQMSQEEVESFDELRTAASAVYALTEYQQYCIYHYQSWEQVTDLSVSRSDGDTGYQASATVMSGQLSDEQRKEVWDTFCQELDSADFHYTDTDAYGEDNQSVYWIGMDTLKQSNIPDDLRTLVRARIPGQVYSALSGYNSGYQVPACCTRTIALIEADTQEYGATYDYSGMGVN